MKPGSPTKAGASVITRVASKTPSGPASLHKAGVAVVSAVAMRGRTTTSTQQRLRAQDDLAAHEEADAVRRREEALAKKAEEEATATMESLKASVRPPGSCCLLPCTNTLITSFCPLPAAQNSAVAPEASSWSTFTRKATSLHTRWTGAHAAMTGLQGEVMHATHTS